MAKVDDVAAAVLARTGRIDTWRFQKLVYYCQAWNLAWDGVPLFPDRVEAWANGPVIPELYLYHRGRYELDAWPRGDAARLTPKEAGTIESVIEAYGDKPGHWLAALTHLERPWIEARTGLEPGERGKQEITQESMADYYAGLL